MDAFLSPKTKELAAKLKQFMREEIAPLETRYMEETLAMGADWRQWFVPECMEVWKQKAKSLGLWNLFLPDAKLGAGLSHAEYAPLAEIMGHIPFAAEAFNCSAPDTGNMEVLYKYGSDEQKEQWLTPLLAGSIRSVFFMTEPDVASSDATNMQATCRIEGDEVVLNGRKWWSSGLGHPSCKVGIFMGVTDPDAPRHQRHSMVLVPISSVGLTIERMLPVFNRYDAPEGHGQARFENVRVPISNIIAGPGRGFEIAQGRLGPGRIHHCMRLIGASERALGMMIRRAQTRRAFGKDLVDLGGNRDIIADSRIQIDMARLLTHHAAKLMDTVGIFEAMTEIAAIKVVAPNVATKVIDAALQMYGGAGVSNDVVLSFLYGYARVLRLADGPDEVHRRHIARLELKHAAKRVVVP